MHSNRSKSFWIYLILQGGEKNARREKKEGKEKEGKGHGKDKESKMYDSKLSSHM